MKLIKMGILFLALTCVAPNATALVITYGHQNMIITDIVQTAMDEDGLSNTQKNYFPANTNWCRAQIVMGTV